MAWQSCRNLQGKGLGGTRCILMKLPQRAPWSYKPPQASSSNDKYLEVAIKSAGLGVYLEGPALGSLFPCCKADRCKPGPSLGQGAPGLGAGRENTSTTRLVRAGKTNFHHPLAILPPLSFPQGCHQGCSPAATSFITSVWTHCCPLSPSAWFLSQKKDETAKLCCFATKYNLCTKFSIFF